MKYKIEIWQYHNLVDSHESDDIADVLNWYRCNWYATYDNGGCSFHLYRDGEKVSLMDECLMPFLE